MTWPSPRTAMIKDDDDNNNNFNNKLTKVYLQKKALMKENSLLH